MAFTANIVYGGKSYPLEWDNGEIETDPVIRTALESLVETIVSEEWIIGPIRMSLDAQDWDNGMTVFWLCKMLNNGTEIEAFGEIPEPPPVPTGAVI